MHMKLYVELKTRVTIKNECYLKAYIIYVHLEATSYKRNSTMHDSATMEILSIVCGYYKRRIACSRST